jgi:hypothetical protein
LGIAAELLLCDNLKKEAMHCFQSNINKAPKFRVPMDYNHLHSSFYLVLLLK